MSQTSQDQEQLAIRRASIAGVLLSSAHILLAVAVWSRLLGTFSLVLAGAGGAVSYVTFIAFMAAFSRDKLRVQRGLIWSYAAINLSTIIVMFANFYRWAGITCSIPLKDGTASSATYIRNIWDCVYLSIITITTVGYGDCSPTSTGGRIIASIEALSGYVLLAVLVNTLIKLLKIP